MDWNQLGRYLAGEASPEETEAMRRWLDEHPGDARMVAALDAATTHVAGLPVDVERALHAVKERRRSRYPARFAGWLAAAAVLLFAVLMWKRGGPEAGPSATYATQLAIRDTILLGDGSRVILAPASTMQLRDRDIELMGSAFFDIRHDGVRPYVVRAGGAVIRDIGTQFSVRAYRDEPLVVVVRQGAVDLALAASSIRLDSGDVGMVEVDGRLARREARATDDDLAWMEGRLVFRNAPMGQVVADLRRWYGVQLRVADSTLRQRHFTGSFTSDPAPRVLDVIALALGGRIEWRGDTATLTPAPPPG